MKAHERDLEGITFVVNPPKDDRVTGENVEPKSAKANSYLEKFAGWDDDIASALQNFYETGRGVEELECPHDDHGIQMDVTLMVDEVFYLDTSETIQGNFRVYDNTLYINEVVEYGDLTQTELFDKVISETEELNLNGIKVSLRRVDEFRDALRDTAFSVDIEEDSRGYERLKAEYTVN